MDYLYAFVIKVEGLDKVDEDRKKLLWAGRRDMTSVPFSGKM